METEAAMRYCISSATWTKTTVWQCQALASMESPREECSTSLLGHKLVAPLCKMDRHCSLQWRLHPRPRNPILNLCSGNALRNARAPRHIWEWARQCCWQWKNLETTQTSNESRRETPWDFHAMDSKLNEPQRQASKWTNHKTTVLRHLYDSLQT